MIIFKPLWFGPSEWALQCCLCLWGMPTPPEGFPWFRNISVFFFSFAISLFCLCSLNWKTFFDQFVFRVEFICFVVGCGNFMGQAYWKHLLHNGCKEKCTFPLPLSRGFYMHEEIILRVNCRNPPLLSPFGWNPPYYWMSRKPPSILKFNWIHSCTIVIFSISIEFKITEREFLPYLSKVKCVLQKIQ